MNHAPRGDGTDIGSTVTVPDRQATQVDGAPPLVGGSTDEPAPVRHDRYVVLGELGRGGMGRVLRAYDPKLLREVAIKQVHRSALGADAKASLVVEARAMAKLSHPNVVSVHDVEELPSGEVVLVMEYVRGTTLRAWLSEQSRSWATGGWSNYGQRVILRHDLGDGNVYHTVYAHHVVVDQSMSTGWVDLGTFEFAAGDGQSVRLDDNTGEAFSLDRVLVFDAIRATPSDGGDAADNPGLVTFGDERGGEQGCACTTAPRRFGSRGGPFGGPFGGWLLMMGVAGLLGRRRGRARTR